jgi:putative flippase GtrA
MFTFLKAQTASLVASAVDFLATLVAVELLGCWYMAGTIIGTVSGGLAHFMLGRNWVFNAAHRKMPAQLTKYFLVWTGSLVLNASGVFVLTHYGGVHYLFSKVFTSIMVGFFYNFIIQKQYVFK